MILYNNGINMSKNKEQGLLQIESNGHSFPIAKYYDIKEGEVWKWQNTTGKYLDTIKIY